MTASMTQWGYSVLEEMPSLISYEDFMTATGNEMSGSAEQIQAVLDAASNSIRSYCHWHISPSLTCSWRGDADGCIVQLPTMNVTSIHSVIVNGVELAESDYAWRDSGLIRLARPVHDDWGRPVAVEFEAGCDSDAVAAIVTQVAVNNLVAPAGVLREAAGEVSITYNQTAVGVTGGVRLMASDRTLLSSFRLPPTR